jgi:hypothetical protein
VASKHRTILVFGAQPNAFPPDPKPAALEVTADIVESLMTKSLAKDDLLGRLCGSLVAAKIRRGVQG